MIAIRFERKGGKIFFFESKGHAGFAEEGEDIVCAAVSALSINAVNSLQAFTDDSFTVDQGDGYLAIRFDDAGLSEPSHEACLLMESLALGLQSIEESYGRQYLNVTFEE